MTNQNKLSRREAIKLLGATAGASLLANIPAEWSKPELSGSVLPAHAQTSCSEFSVFIDILPTDGFFLLEIAGGPIYDDFTGGADNRWRSENTLTWYCRSGCLLLYLDLYGTSGQVSIKTLTGTHIEHYGSNDNRDIAIEMDTGAYDSSVGWGATAGSCELLDVEV